MVSHINSFDETNLVKLLDITSTYEDAYSEYIDWLKFGKFTYHTCQLSHCTIRIFTQ